MSFFGIRPVWTGERRARAGSRLFPAMPPVHRG